MAVGNPSACGKCDARFRPQSRRCRACRNYRAAHCQHAQCPLEGTGDERCAICDGPFAVARSCTKCKWNGKGHPICWTCPGPNKLYQTDGETIVTLGALEDPDGFIQDERIDRLQVLRSDKGDEIAGQIDGDDDDAPFYGVTNLPPEAEKPLLQLLVFIAQMKRNQLLVLHGMLNGLNVAEASESAGFSKQNGQKSIGKLCRMMPQLRAFFSSCFGNSKRMKYDVG